MKSFLLYYNGSKEQAPPSKHIGNVFYEYFTSAGTHYFSTSETGWYEIELVGGGAGAGSWDGEQYGRRSYWTCGAGGSGAYFKGMIYLESGSNYTVTVGGAGHSFRGISHRYMGMTGDGGSSGIYRNGQPIVIAHGGTGCECPVLYHRYGYGGVVEIKMPNLVQTIISRNGNNGTYGDNGYAASVYDFSVSGIGASGRSWADFDDYRDLLENAHPGMARFSYKIYGGTSSVIYKLGFLHSRGQYHLMFQRNM